MLANNYAPALLKIYKKEGFVAAEKSFVAIEKDKMIAWGNDAEKYVDDKEILVINPFKQGLIEDYSCTRVMMSALIKKYVKNHVFKRQRIVFSTLEEYSEIQKTALEETLYMTGGTKEVNISDDRSVFDRPELLKSFFQKNECDILIDITQDDPYLYVQEMVEELKAYANKYGMQVEIMVK